jgi:urease accessory protein
MLRIAAVISRSKLDPSRIVDCVLLDATDRHRRRVVLVGEEGATYLLNLPEPRQLREGDGLVLEDGNIVRIAGKPEPLMEVSAPNASELARLAWHIGNRHTDVQLVGETLRIRRDHVLEEMLRGLGGTITALDAPFDPEPGAYAGHGHHDE